MRGGKAIPVVAEGYNPIDGEYSPGQSLPGPAGLAAANSAQLMETFVYVERRTSSQACGITLS